MFGIHLSPLLCLGLLTFGCSSDKEPTWVTANRDTLVVSVELNGTLEAADSEAVGPPTIPNMGDFKISALAPEGDVVKVGDMLVGFDPTSLKERLSTRENRRDAALVQLAKKRQEISLAKSDENLRIAEAEAGLRKAKMSAELEGELVANLALQKAKVAVLAAEENLSYLKTQAKRQRASAQRSAQSLQNTVKQSQEEVDEINESIAKLVVVSKRAGTVVYKTNWNGDKFKVGNSVWGRNVLEVASLDSMVAEATVEEADSAMLKTGQRVHLRLEAHPDSDVRGTITKVETAVHKMSRENPIKVITIKLSVDSVEGLQMRPGMRFRGTIDAETLPDVLVLPRSAIFGSSQGPIAYKREGDGVAAVLVELGKSGKRNIQIKSGLSKGDEVSAHNLAETK